MSTNVSLTIQRDLYVFSLADKRLTISNTNSFSFAQELKQMLEFVYTFAFEEGQKSFNGPLAEH